VTGAADYRGYYLANAIGHGMAANELANSSAGTRAERARPDQVAEEAALVERPENRMSVLLTRRFRVRALDAPPRLTWGYALDHDQIRVNLPPKNPLLRFYALVSALARFAGVALTADPCRPLTCDGT
jgi:hypothetical protein